MTDEPDKFQSSDLTIPSDKLEGWRSLSNKMPVSNGPGSAGKQNTQWLRKLSIVVYSGKSAEGGDFGGGGEKSQNQIDREETSGIELSALRVNFTIKHAQAGSPAIFWCRIYNMAPQTMMKVVQFTRIQVKAGYQFAGYGKIFDGTVVQYRRGKENPTDTYLEIHAGDGEDRINRATVFANFASGTSDKDILMEVAKAAKMPVKFMDKDIGKEKTQRDQTVAESAKSKLRELMLKYDSTYFIENGELVLLKNGNARDGAAIVLSPKTGLTGLPEVTPQGIQAQCLLNPNIKIGGKVQIDASVLSGVAFTPGSAVKMGKNGQIENPTGGAIKPVATFGQQLETAFTSPVGKYKVILLEHTGDTRGTPWYCNMTCVALDDQDRVMVAGNPSTVHSRAAAAAVGKPNVDEPAKPPSGMAGDKPPPTRLRVVA